MRAHVVVRVVQKWIKNDERKTRVNKMPSMSGSVCVDECVCACVSVRACGVKTKVKVRKGREWDRQAGKIYVPQENMVLGVLSCREEIAHPCTGGNEVSVAVRDKRCNSDGLGVMIRSKEMDIGW